MAEKKLVFCVDGLCIKGGKLLLFRRAVDPFKGYWHVVGGHVEENQALEEALKREFQEEANLTIKIGELLTARVEETPDRIKIIFAFRVSPINHDIKLNSEHDAYGWFTKFPTKSVYNYSKHLKQHDTPF